MIDLSLINIAFRKPTIIKREGSWIIMQTKTGIKQYGDCCTSTSTISCSKIAIH